jgi:aquaporin Z
MTYKKYIAEFIGTFFLTLAVCMTTFSKVSADIQPIAIGMTLMALIYTMGYMSGAHFNPAITIGIWLRGRIDSKDAGIYIVAQLVGAAAAALISGVLISAKPQLAPVAITTPQYFSMIPALLAELIGAFALMWIVLNVATTKTLEGNNFYGITIGLGLTGLIYIFGSVSGSVFNPAVAMATCITQFNSWQNIWIGLVGTIAGAALAAVLFKFINSDEA